MQPTSRTRRRSRRRNLDDATDTGVYELKRVRKKGYNSRVLSVYFKSHGDLRKAKRAARKAKVPLATFIRDAALKLAEKVLAA
jgi:hypothetical protein